MKTKKERRNNKGITLIALVVTIIVLLILAGISIGAITGNNGIINQAQNAKDDTQYSQWEEQIDTAIIDAESKHRNPTMDDVIDELINKEIISNESQVDKTTGAITTNEPSYVIEDKLNDYIPFGPGMIADKNETYTDDNGDTATIPKGFEILEEASTVDDGLVVQDEEENQFVWIPVETPVANSEEEGNTTKAMAVKIGDNYRGLLYNFTQNGSSVKDNCTTAFNSYREPDFVELDNYIEYNNNLFTKDSLQQKYNNMIESVREYHGFYIGRYELGLEGTKAVSKNASINKEIMTADASNSITNMWYGLYKKCEEFAPEDSSKAFVSSMIWGSQYDAMLNWAQQDGIKVSELASSETNTEKNSTEITGSNSNDVIKNIYDIYGCHYDWTIEAGNSGRRVSRGGYYSGNEAPNNRKSAAPTWNTPTYSSRIMLYIK